MPKIITPEEEKKIREKLFAVSARAFLRDGYEATSMKSLAEEAGCTTGKFYGYYPGKQALLIRLLETLFGKNRKEAERLAAKKSDRSYGVAAYLYMILEGCALHENLAEICREGLLQAEAKAATAAMIGELYGAETLSGMEKLRTDAMVSMLPDCIAAPGEWTEDAGKEEILTLLLTVLGEDAAAAKACAGAVLKDAPHIRERAYDALVKLLEGPKKRASKK